MKNVNENTKYTKVEDNLTSVADTLGAHMSDPWIRGAVVTPGSADRFPEQQVCKTWPHEEEGVSIPMPKGKLLRDLKTEFYQRHEGAGLGPVTQAWMHGTFEWARLLKKRFFGDSPQVTGLWSVAQKRFRRRLRWVKDKALADVVMKEIAHGVRLPFASEPAYIFEKRNHPELSVRAPAVFEALREQLSEKSLEPFVFKGGVFPKGVYSLRWVEKSDPDKVRLTLNGRPVNPSFPREACTIELETHRQLRTFYMHGQMYLGFDLHNGFFNQQYHVDDRDWVCFRIHESELRPAHARYFRGKYPNSWKDGYIYFRYRGLVMGLSPSCQQLARVNQTMLRAWRCFAVQGVTWDATSFIDDLMAWVNGTFEGALELALRLLAEQVCLGFSVNLNEKSTIIPTTYYCHIGICISSTALRFTLPASRVVKMTASLHQLRRIVRVGSKVPAKSVARFVGQLWSANIVCYRAVAVMARGMIRTLATMIRTSEAMDESDPNRLRYILRRIWGGNVVWTVEAQQELRFWLSVDFATLSAPISHDAWQSQVTKWVADPTSGKIAEDVKVFAVDTSDSMSGGGEFIRDGWLWKMKKGMAVRLTPSEVLTSSTLRELLGVWRLDLSLIPASCRKAILALDSQAAVQCILKGSRVWELQKIVRKIYLRQLRYGRVLWPVWVRRCMSIIMQCDERSRLLDNHAYATDPAVFWKANAIAQRLWGRGFQWDACADMHNVQPGNRQTKLPFYSRWASPHASGTDMLQQSWRCKVNWCNPPFALIPRVLALLREQQACAAVVVPRGENSERTPWVRSLRLQTASLLKVLAVDQHTSVLFLDFSSHPPARAFIDSPSAESLSCVCREHVLYLRWHNGSLLRSQEFDRWPKKRYRTSGGDLLATKNSHARKQKR